MNRSRTKRVTRKKVIPLHFQKSQTSLSQLLATASYKKHIKELQKNNKVLAVALQDARLDLANTKDMLQRCSKDETKILNARAKLKDMGTCIQTLVTGLNEVMSCLDIKPISWFSSSQDEMRLQIRRPDLDPIEESNSMIDDSNLNNSISNRNPLSPVICEQGLISEPTPTSSTDNCFKGIPDSQKVSDLNTLVADQDATTGRPYKSVPCVSPPGSPVTPELDISHSDEYFQKLLDHGIISSLPENVTLKNNVKPTSLNESKSKSRIPLKKKTPLPNQPIEFSPLVCKLNRKTFVVKEDARKSSGINETFTVPNSVQSIINQRDRRETYFIAPVPEIASPAVSTIPSGAVEMADATAHFNEDMELTSVIPIHKITPVKNDAFSAAALCKENLSVVVSEQKNAALAVDDTIKFKSLEMNQDMEFTCVIPIYNPLTSENNASKDINVPTVCANDVQLSRNVSKAVENVVVEQGQFLNTSNPRQSNLMPDKQNSTGAPMVSEQENNPTVSKEDFPAFKCPDIMESPVIEKSLERKSSRCSNRNASLKTKGRKVSNRNKRSSISCKNTASPKSPKISVGLEAIPQTEYSSISKDSVRKRSTVTYAKYFSSDSDNDDEMLTRKTESKISELPASLNASPDIKGSTSSIDSESSSDANLDDGFKSLGRCTLKSPRKTSKKRGPYKFEKTRKSSKMHSVQSSNIAVGSPSGEKNTISSRRKSVQFAFDECLSAFQNIKTREQQLNNSNMDLKATKKNKVSEQHSSPGTVSNRGILKNRIPSHKKSSHRISHNTSNSITSVENLQKDSPTAASKLDKLLAALDSTIGEDNGCDSKNMTNSALQSTKGDQVRPFSGVSERNSKKRATDYSSDVFNELETICPLEISPKSLGTSQQFQSNKAENDCEETELYDLKNIIKVTQTGSKSNHCQQSKSKSEQLKPKGTVLNYQNPENNMPVIQDALVNSSKAKSSIIQAHKIISSKKDDIILKSDRNKIKSKNVEVDILTSFKTTPLKTIQLPSTETCTSDEINSQGVKILSKPKSHKRKKFAQEVTKVKSKDSASRNGELNELKSSDVQNVQPSKVLEPLPIEDNSFTSTKDSTSLGNERPRRTRPLISMKEPTLNKKMRR